ncbi:MAG: hypothetical protein MUC83_05590, partial [Pirellula sp.]|nr:hypothetical protein [Pirellula sp.]
MHPQLGAATSQPQLGAGSQQADLRAQSLPKRFFKTCLRAGLQHGSTSQPQDGAATSQPQLGAGAGAGSQQGAGAGAGSQQVGAVSQQEALRAWSLAIKPLSNCLRAGLQHGSTSQPQDGAATSQPQ